MRRTWVALLAAAGLAGCATVQPSPPAEVGPPPPPPPPPVAAVIGQGVYVTRTGAHGSCAGESVALFRDTPNSRARILALYGSADGARLSVATVTSRAAKLGPSDNTLAASVACDTDGRFSVAGPRARPLFPDRAGQGDQREEAQNDLVVMRHLDLASGETEISASRDHGHRRSRHRRGADHREFVRASGPGGQHVNKTSERGRAPLRRARPRPRLADDVEGPPRTAGRQPPDPGRRADPVLARHALAGDEPAGGEAAAGGADPPRPEAAEAAQGRQSRFTPRSSGDWGRKRDAAASSPCAANADS